MSTLQAIIIAIIEVPSYLINRSYGFYRCPYGNARR